MANWEFEKAKQELELFWEYAYELYGGLDKMDEEDTQKLAQLETPFGEVVAEMHDEWRKKKGL